MFNQSVLNQKEHEFFLFQVGHSQGDKFLSDVVHKIKNNLGGIGGFASLLERDLRRNDPRKKLLDRIIEGVHRLNEFVIHLMTLVQEVEPCFEKVGLKPLLKEICENMHTKNQNQKEGSAIYTEFPNEKIVVTADPHLIRELFYHAFHFVQLINGEIDKVQVKPIKDKKIDVEIIFSDGVIPSEKTSDIIQFIEDCEPIEARLSLAVVYKIADLHHASVSMKNISKNSQRLLIQLTKGTKA